MAFRFLRLGFALLMVLTTNACSFAAAPGGPIEDFLDGGVDTSVALYDAASVADAGASELPDSGETIPGEEDAGDRGRDGGFLRDAFVTVGDGELPACRPSVDGFSGCSDGFACYIVDGYGTTACLEPGTLSEGDACDVADDRDDEERLCAPGMICAGIRATCRKLCAVARPRCGDSELCEPLVYGAGDLGICVPDAARFRSR